MSSNSSSVGNDSGKNTLISSAIELRKDLHLQLPQVRNIHLEADSSPDGSVTGNPQMRLNDILDMSTTDAAPVAGMDIVEVDKPHSKTAIGRVSQKVENLPLILTVELETKIDGELVKSHTLRREAARLWLENNQAESFRELAIDVGSQLGVVRLLLHTKDEEERKSVEGKLDGLKEQSITMPKKATAQSSGKDKTIDFKITAPQGSNDKTYERSLRFLLRDMSTKAGQLKSLPRTISSSHNFDPLLPGFVRSLASSQPLDYHLYLRHQPSADFSREEIMTDFDVVPCAPGKPLYEFVLDLVGQTALGSLNASVIDQWLPKMKHILLGMHVRCIYVPGKRTGNGQEKAKLLGPGEISQGRRFQIRDVQAHDIANDEFDIGNRKYDTYDYFTKSKVWVLLLVALEPNNV
jgi:hypothetical protein